MRCSKCGTEDELKFYKDKMHTNLWICKKCSMIYSKERRRYLKHKCVQIKGGKCSKCGYDKNYAALEFHHTNDDKEFEISNLNRRNWDDIQDELKKCILLCSNCHKEQHNPLYKIDSKFEFNHEKAILKTKRNVLKNSVIKCTICNKDIIGPRKEQKYCSEECSCIGQQRCIRPSIKELEILMKEKSWNKIGNLFGVSGNTIRDWAKSYGIYVERKK